MTALAILEPTAETEPFWQGLRRGALLARRCTGCTRLHPTPQRFCPTCGSADGHWEALPDPATLYSYTVQERPPPGRADLPTPFALAIVEFGEKHRMLGLLIGPTENLRIGQTLRFEPWPSGDLMLPAFAVF